MGNCGPSGSSSETPLHDSVVTTSTQEDEKQASAVRVQQGVEHREKKENFIMKDKDVTASTSWTVSLPPTGVASLSYTLSGSSTAVPFVIKGVCYSPCPIGSANTAGPNIGDWFWDSYTSAPNTQKWNWSRYWDTNASDATYRHDLDNIVNLGANTIRVYCMLSEQIKNGSFDSSHVFTHSAFLDACYQRNLFVLIGFPMPITMFQKGSESTPVNSDWTDALTQLLLKPVNLAIGSHPAVLGFIFMNEQDGSGTSFPPTKSPDATLIAQLKYYWEQCEAIASICKTNAPDKLCGQAFHDMPQQWTLTNAPYINKMKSVDFWGVNTYQTKSLDSVFKSITPASGKNGVKPIGFNHFSKVLSKFTHLNKPVILTEIGWPATGHKGNILTGALYYDCNTGANTATTMNLVLSQAFDQKSYPLCLGMCYFEYCDEWWSQGQYKINGVLCPVFPIYTWNGGPAASGFPNGFWDNEGFGLFQAFKNINIPPESDNEESPVNWDVDGNGPYAYTDPITGRAAVIKALVSAFKTV